MDLILAEILRRFGLTHFYRGYDALLHAVLLVAEDSTRLHHAMVDIYFATAKALGMKPANVEHNIRTMVHRAWQVDKALLSEIAGYRLDGPPTAIQFIEILAHHINEKTCQRK